MVVRYTGGKVESIIDMASSCFFHTYFARQQFLLAKDRYPAKAYHTVGESTD